MVGSVEILNITFELHPQMTDMDIYGCRIFGEQGVYKFCDFGLERSCLDFSSDIQDRNVQTTIHPHSILED